LEIPATFKTKFDGIVFRREDKSSSSPISKQNGQTQHNLKSYPLL